MGAKGLKKVGVKKSENFKNGTGCTCAGSPTWNVQPETPDTLEEALQAKTKELAHRFKDLFIAFALGVDLLANEKDSMGMLAFSVIVKTILSDGSNRLADPVTAAEIKE